MTNSNETPVLSEIDREFPYILIDETHSSPGSIVARFRHKFDAEIARDAYVPFGVHLILLRVDAKGEYVVVSETVDIRHGSLDF